MTSVQGRGKAVILVIPVYNSARSLALIVSKTAAAIATINRPWHVIFVDDRSPDPHSWEAIRALSESHDNVSGIRLLKNRGRAAAVFCGLSFAETFDPEAIVVVMDDDLQHDPADIPKLVGALERDPDADVAVAQFPKKQHGLIERFGSWLKSRLDQHYYGLSKDVRMSSFLALDPRVVAALTSTSASFPLFGPQLIKIAERFTGVVCVHGKRYDGVPSYTFGRRLRQFYLIALGDTVLLLQLLARLGTMIALLAFFAAVYFSIRRFFFGADAPEGWTSLFVAVVFFSGLNMFLLGLIGTNIVRSKENIERLPAWTARDTIGPAAQPPASSSTILAR